METLVEAVAKERGVELGTLRRRARNHRERDLAMYLCREVGEKTLKEIGAWFGIGTAAAGHAVSRVKQRHAEDRKLAKVVAGAKVAVIRKLET